jgi:hypothetical protein
VRPGCTAERGYGEMTMRSTTAAQSEHQEQVSRRAFLQDFAAAVVAAAAALPLARGGEQPVPDVSSGPPRGARIRQRKERRTAEPCDSR